MAARKKNKKLLRLLLLTSIVVLLAGVYYLVVTLQEKKNTELGDDTTNPSVTQDNSVAICPLREEDLVKVSFENSVFSATIQKLEDGSYVLEGEPDFPLHQEKAAAAFSNIDTPALRVIAENAELSVYGLDEPEILIIAEDKNGNKFRLRVGDRVGTLSESGYYAAIEGENTVYQVTSALYTYYNMSETSWITSEILPSITSSVITAVTVESKEFGNFAAYHTGEEGDPDSNPLTGNWKMTEPYKHVLDLSAEGMEAVLKNYEFLMWTSTVDYREENLPLYGLSEPVTKLTIDYKMESDLTEDMLPAQFKLNIGDRSPDGGYYVCLDGSSHVYTMTEDKVKQLVDIDEDSVINNRFSVIFINTLSKIEVTLPDSTHVYEMRYDEEIDETTGETETVEWFIVDGVELSVDSTSFNTYYTNFVKMTANGVLPEGTVVTGEPRVTIHYDRTEDTYDEMVIEYLPYNEYNDAVRINGVVMYTIDKRDVDSLINAINKYVPE